MRPLILANATIEKSLDLENFELGYQSVPLSLFLQPLVTACLVILDTSECQVLAAEVCFWVLSLAVCPFFFSSNLQYSLMFYS